MTKLQQRLETCLAGLLYVAIGTIVAVQVNAQGSPRDPAAAPGAAPAKAANCEANAAPDALCTIAPAKPEARVCFSSKHPRCFDLQKTKVIQSLNGSPVHDTTIDAKQSEAALKAVKDYRAWLESKKAPAPTSVCRNIVTVDVGTDHKDACVSGLAKKELQEKNKELIAVLENPTGAIKSPRSSGP